jgi:hypothetical protein
MGAAQAKPAAPSGVVDSVLSTVLGSNPGAPVQSPASWMVLAVARRQNVSEVTTTTAATATAAASQPPTITSVVIGKPNSITGAVTAQVTALDPEGESFSYRASLVNLVGQAVITKDGVLTVTPAASERHRVAQYSGTINATVRVTVTDVTGASSSLEIRVPVSPQNSAPIPIVQVSKPDARGSVTIKVVSTDADGDQPTFDFPKSTAKGTTYKQNSTALNNGTWVYTPTGAAAHAAASPTATDSDKVETFTITVRDGYGGRTTVPVTVTVSPLNRAPVVNASKISKPDLVTGIATGSVTAVDADRDKLTYSASSPYATITFKPDGSFIYTPTADARAAARNSNTTLTDTFRVVVLDGYGGNIPDDPYSGPSSVQLSCRVMPANVAPVLSSPTIASPDLQTGVVIGRVNAKDPDGDAITFAGTINTAKGTAKITSPTGDFTYTPTSAARHYAARDGASAADKSDTFTATVTDQFGAVSSAPVTVTIIPANAAPVAGSPIVGVPNATGGVVKGSLTATDADKDVLTYSAPTATAKGKVTINPSTGAFTFTPTGVARTNAGMVGVPSGENTDTIPVTIRDGYGGSTTVTVTVVIA